METPTNSNNKNTLADAPKEHAIKRLRHMWRFFFITNLALGAYMFGTARKSEMNIDKEKTCARRRAKSGPVPKESALAPVIEGPALAPTTGLTKEHTALPVEEKRKLFRWILNEKVKIKPKDCLEKNRIDEELAILEQFINAESIPDL